MEAIEADIRLLGVRRLSLFGSVREEGGVESEVDPLVEFAPGEKLDAYGSRQSCWTCSSLRKSGMATDSMKLDAVKKAG